MYTLKECHGLNPCTLSGKTPEGGGMKDAPYSSFQIISPYPGGVQVCAILRIWQTKARAYASLWVMSPDSGPNMSGHGSASGYGYHRGSAAVSQAIKSAGFAYGEYIEGAGGTVYPEALAACCRAIGHKGKLFYIEG